MMTLEKHINATNYSLHTLNGKYVLIRNTKMLGRADENKQRHWERRVMPFKEDYSDLDWPNAFYIKEGDYRKYAVKVKSL